VALTANDANQNKCKCAFMRFKLACGQRAGIASCNLHISVSSPVSEHLDLELELEMEL